MMFYQTLFSSGKSEGLHRKDELYNELLKKYFRANSIDFPKALADSDGAYVVQVITIIYLVLNLNVLAQTGCLSAYNVP